MWKNWDFLIGLVHGFAGIVEGAMGHAMFNLRDYRQAVCRIPFRTVFVGE